MGTEIDIQDEMDKIPTVDKPPRSNGLPWKEAGEEMSFAKVGTYGVPGAGKTFTLTRLALGLMPLIGKTEAYMIDTETGSDFVARLFHQAGLKLRVIKSRAFRDTVAAIEQLRNEETVLVIDSVTHIWAELMESYCRRLHKTELSFPDFRVLKGTDGWLMFSDGFLNSRLHVFVAGRLQDIYEMLDVSEPGRKPKYGVAKVDERMKAERYFGYEPSLLFRMSAVRDPDLIKQLRKTNSQKERLSISKQLGAKSGYVHIAEVLKDRSDLLNGQSFTNPTYADFAPHFEFLGIGDSAKGKHLAIDTERTSDELFGEPEGNHYASRQRQTIAAEEVEGLIFKYFAGQTGAQKQARLNVIERVFGTRSALKVKAMDVGLLEAAYALQPEGKPSILEQACIAEKERMEVTQE